MTVLNFMLKISISFLYESLVYSPHKGQSFDVIFVVSLNKLLIKQFSCQWFEMP